jgi:hypothetical protein
MEIRPRVLELLKDELVDTCQSYQTYVCKLSLPTRQNFHAYDTQKSLTSETGVKNIFRLMYRRN